jgi:hypothetical protein
MTPSDAIHRLRVRANNAEAAGEHALAADLRATIAVIKARFAQRPTLKA